MTSKVVSLLILFLMACPSWGFQFVTRDGRVIKIVVKDPVVHYRRGGTVDVHTQFVRFNDCEKYWRWKLHVPYSCCRTNLSLRGEVTPNNEVVIQRGRIERNDCDICDELRDRVRECEKKKHRYQQRHTYRPGYITIRRVVVNRNYGRRYYIHSYPAGPVTVFPNGYIGLSRGAIGRVLSIPSIGALRFPAYNSGIRFR